MRVCKAELQGKAQVLAPSMTAVLVSKPSTASRHTMLSSVAGASNLNCRWKSDRGWKPVQATAPSKSLLSPNGDVTSTKAEVNQSSFLYLGRVLWNSLWKDGERCNAAHNLLTRCLRSEYWKKNVCPVWTEKLASSKNGLLWKRQQHAR